METETIVLNMAYVAMLGSTHMRTATRIRVMLLVASVGFTAFAVLTGIWSMLAWNLVTSALHIVSLVRQVRAGRSVELSDLETRWRQYTFPTASPAAFRAAWAAGRERRMTDAVLTTLGHAPPALSLIVDGSVEVRDGGHLLARLGPGAFVGEMGTLRDRPACADAATVGDVTVRQWSAHDLATLADADPAAERELRRAATADALAKLVPEPHAIARRIT